MIDEFLQYLLTPVIAILVQVVLIFVNYHFCKDKSRLRIPKVILFTVSILIIFGSLWAIVYQTVLGFTLAGISLCLLFLQLLINIEYLLEEYEND